MATTMHTETSVDSSGKTREVEVFVFHNPAKRKKDRENAESGKQPLGKKQKPANKPEEPPRPTMNLDTAQRDIRNFGISKLVGRSKTEGYMAQLRSLGAEIPKNWVRKLDKKKRHEENAQRRQDMKAGLKTKKAVNPNKAAQRSELQKKRKEREEGVFFDSKVGRYSNRDGVQYISSDEIRSIRASAAKSKK